MLLTLNNSGLPIKLEKDTGKLFLDASLLSDHPKTRMLSESLPYYETRKSFPSDLPLYYMYRDVKKKVDTHSIDLSPFRYDITVLLPGNIEQEPIKTIGHVHPISKLTKTSYTYTEVYSVIHGTAHYILQKFSTDFNTIIDVVDLEVKEGEHVLIPSFYGHVTVNVTDEPLVMANILFRDFSSNYGPYQANKGAALYLKRNQNTEIFSELNINYSNLPSVKKATSIDFIPPELKQFEPLYTQWISNLKGFTYLYTEI
jgi:glucose-6-phosphate isomerase